MEHNYSQVFNTDYPEWQEILDIFKKNEHIDKKKTPGRVLHHKFPRAFSKLLNEEIDNTPNNLVSLSIDEHFIVHYYYYKLAKGIFKSRMALALAYMMESSFNELSKISPEIAIDLSKKYAQNQQSIHKLIGQIHIGSKRTPEALQNMRKAQQKRHKEQPSKPLSPEARLKISKALKGKPKSSEMKQKLSKTRKGIVFSEEHRKHLSDARQNRILTKEQRYKLGSARRGKHFIFSEEHKKHISEAKKGFKFSKEAKEKMSLAHKGKKLGPMSEEHKIKLSLSCKGKKRGPMPEEQKARLSAKIKGRHWKLINGKRIWDAPTHYMTASDTVPMCYADISAVTPYNQE